MVSNSVSLCPLETRTQVREGEQARHDNFGVALRATGVPPWQWTEVAAARDEASLRSGFKRWLRWGALGLVVAAGASGAVAAAAIAIAGGAAASPAESAALRTVEPLVAPAVLQVAPGVADMVPDTAAAAALVTSPTGRAAPSVVVEEPGFLEANQVVVAIAAPAKTEVVDEEPVAYVVSSGDTLSEIASSHDVALPELLDANGLTANSVIRIGDELLIP